jgi:hypothetical protein
MIKFRSNLLQNSNEKYSSKAQFCVVNNKITVLGYGFINFNLMHESVS